MTTTLTSAILITMRTGKAAVKKKDQMTGRNALKKKSKPINQSLLFPFFRKKASNRKA